MRFIGKACGFFSALTVLACGSSEDDKTPTKNCTVDTSYAPVIDPANFVANVTNSFFPLPAGRKWTYVDGIEQIVVEVTTERKTILGVSCTVVHDIASADGVTLEDTFDWYAQDKDGAVWYFGEDTTEYANGKPVSTKGSWEAGVNGARPGTIIPADLSVGTQYRQEYYACEAEDMGEILESGVSVEVKAGSYTGCLKTKDTTPLEPDVLEEKYYCPDVGLVAADDKASGGREELSSLEGP